MFEREARPIGADGDGYLQFNDAEALLALAIEEDLVARLERKPGNYVVAGCPLAMVWPGSRLNDRLHARVNALLVLGHQRTADQDIEFAVNQLVEIAVRALSPGVNDPFTAITCVDHLGSALCRLAVRDMPSPYRHDSRNQLRVIAPADSLPAIMDAAFNQIRQHSRSSAAVAIRLLEAIAVIAGFMYRLEDRVALLRHTEMIARGAREELPEEQDRPAVEGHPEYALLRPALWISSFSILSKDGDRAHRLVTCSKDDLFVHQGQKQDMSNEKSGDMLDKVDSLKGYKLHSLDGEIGKVKEFYFDDLQWAIRYLVADTGNWLADRRVLISPHALQAVDREKRHIAVALTRKQVEDSPSLSSDKPLSRQFEEAYYGYFQWSPYWGGPHLWGVHPTIVSAAEQTGERASGKSAGDPNLRSTNEVGSYHIHARDGEIGHVEDFLIDEETWAIRYLVVGTRNWWPGKKVLVSPRWIDRVSWPDSTVFVNLSREAIKQTPEYKEETRLTRDYETALHRLYERRGYWVEERVDMKV